SGQSALRYRPSTQRPSCGIWLRGRQRCASGRSADTLLVDPAVAATWVGARLFKRELMYVGSVVAAICAALLMSAPCAGAASAPASVFPSPGTSSALPGTQITFRGVAPSSIGPVQAVGSSTGAHTGHIAADSDNQG